MCLLFYGFHSSAQKGKMNEQEETMNINFSPEDFFSYLEKKVRYSKNLLFISIASNSNNGPFGIISAGKYF